MGKERLEAICLRDSKPCSAARMAQRLSKFSSTICEEKRREVTGLGVTEQVRNEVRTRAPAGCSGPELQKATLDGEPGSWGRSTGTTPRKCWRLRGG